VEKLRIFMYGEVYIRLLKEQKLVIAKIFGYILTRHIALLGGFLMNLNENHTMAFCVILQRTLL